LLVLSPPILAELYQVLRRPRIRALHRLSDRQIRRAISRVYTLAVVVSVPMELPAIVPHDPKDDPIVMTGVIGRADILCSLDRHLHAAEVVQFCASQGITIERDSELLFELRAAQT
jgi:predicted nucleic acid-binding protein